MNKLNFKYVFYLFALSLLFYLSMNTFVLSKSNKIQNFSVIKPIDVRNIPTENVIPNSPPSSFNYKLSGIMLGEDYSSVTLKKSGKEYVVQIGGLLENKYKLIKVDKEVIIFEFQGKKFTIINRFNNE